VLTDFGCEHSFARAVDSVREHYGFDIGASAVRTATVNNCRFLLLPDKIFPNLGSRSLRLALDRLSAVLSDVTGGDLPAAQTRGAKAWPTARKNSKNENCMRCKKQPKRWDLNSLPNIQLQKEFLESGTLFVVELVDAVARLCCVNLLLHGIGGDGTDEVPIQAKDALAGKHGDYDLVLTNPPFGKKSSVTIVNEAGDTSKESLIINRADFWASTRNKQPNFLQHVFTILKQHGRAAVVVPDNVLFEGGASETSAANCSSRPMSTPCFGCPPGFFTPRASRPTSCSSTGKPAQEKPWTQKPWIYDLRTNLHFTLKESTLKRTDLDDFLWPASIRKTATSAKKASVLKVSPTTTWSNATK
jgi:hypothetical protein